MAKPGRLVVVSNRVPALSIPSNEDERRAQPVGGLVTALRAALEKRGGMWFGWSGNATPRKPSEKVAFKDLETFQLATVDLSRDDFNLFYTLFANRTLWPLLHNFATLAVIRHEGYTAYRRVNRHFAQQLYPLLQPGDLVWVHDYHLIPLGEELRRLGWTGRIGFFLHTPFPSAEAFAILPWAKWLLESFLQYDLAGFHTDRYAFNLIDTLQAEIGGSTRVNLFTRGGDKLRIATHPIGIDPQIFREWAGDLAKDRNRPLRDLASAGKQLILGVDRLDYTKGIPGRLQAFEYLLEHHPDLRGKVTMVQISAPSRSRIPEYIEERERVDRLVGHINGKFGETGWVPVHYLYRSYSQRELARFYNQANICLVTPLRDGMNLVAKEFVACQGDDPGVLVLSKFCGAADTMEEALIVNPYDIAGTTEAIYRALHMGATERRARWEALMEGVRRHTADAWSESFIADLVAA